MSDMLAHSVLVISAAMFDGLWEGLLIAGVVWLGLRMLPQLGAATRYVVWLSTLAALVAIPLLTIAFPRTHAPPRTVTYTVVTDVGAVVPNAAVPSSPTNLPSLPQPAPASTARLLDQIVVSAALPMGAALLWLLVAGARLVLLGLNLLDLARIRRRATLWSSAHDFPVSLSRDVAVPLAVGFLRPQVLLPAALIEEQPSAAVEAIITHEVAHLHRGDVWTNAFARVLEALVALNPVAWFVLRRLSVEREIACDDWVVTRLGAGDIFARALATMASCAGARTPLAAPSAIGSKHSVVARIEQLLDAHPRRLRFSLSALGGTLMLFAMIAIILQTISPVLAYAPEQKTVQVASTCTNHGVLYDFSYYTGDTTKHNWQPVWTVATYNEWLKKYPSQSGRELGVATADVSFDASGKATSVVLVSAPNIPGTDAHIKRHFARGTFEPAVINCKAVATTMRVVIPVQMHASGGTLSNVTPSYPVGWGAEHTSACRVPNLVHDGVPMVPATLPALTASVRVKVDAAGAVTNAAVVASSGSAAFDHALLASARAASYPLDESTGFKPIRPSGALLAWNQTHGYSVYSKCSPLPTEYVWTASHRPSGMVTLP